MIIDELAAKGFQVADGVKAAFDWDAVESYRGFLERENERGGFFSKGDSGRILERHVYECAILAYYVAKQRNVSRGTSVADAGSGPGLPGYLFHCLKDRPRVTLIDSSKRRLGLLEQWIHEKGSCPGGAPPPTVLYGRLEEMKAAYDVVVIRALVPFPFALELVAGIVAIKGFVAHAATSSPDLLVQTERVKYLNHLGFVPRETVDLPDLSALGTRKLSFYQKIGSPSKGVPRLWKYIKGDIEKWAK